MRDLKARKFKMIQNRKHRKMDSEIEEGEEDESDFDNCDTCERETYKLIKTNPTDELQIHADGENVQRRGKQKQIRK